ncbi:acetate--CoA ligase family protein [Desulfococcus sp.]|uniref:acetate--CoA ligase family protein n=1 Tax=Desulfococcus sp. TaxID=2025834 RepID=UPI003593692C
MDIDGPVDLALITTPAARTRIQRSLPDAPISACGTASVGGLLIVGLFGGYGIRFTESLSLMEEGAVHQMGKMVKKRKKPMVLHSLYNSEKPHSLHLLRYYGITVYDSLDIACKRISVLAERGNYLASYHAKTNFILNWGQKAKPEGKRLIKNARREGRSVLLEHEAKRLLHLHGVQVPREMLAETADAAVSFAGEIRGDVALRLVFPDILHKSDAGGVRLGLKSEDDVRGAFDDMMKRAGEFRPDARVRGVLVSPMARSGKEVIIGTKADDQVRPRHHVRPGRHPGGDPEGRLLPRAPHLPQLREKNDRKDQIGAHPERRQGDEAV